MNDSTVKARLVFLIEFLKWYFLKYWQVRTRRVFAQTVTYGNGRTMQHQLVVYCNAVSNLPFLAVIIFLLILPVIIDLPPQDKLSEDHYRDIYPL